RIYLEERPRGARSGDLVLAEVDWSAGDEAPPVGRAKRTLREDARENRFYRLLEEFGLPLGFPESVIQEALALAGGNGDARADTGGIARLDLRDRFIFTIDPANAYDHDDAVSIEEPGDGRLRLGIHIADVSTAVSPGTALDREARARGMSIYLEDGV